MWSKRLTTEVGFTGGRLHERVAHRVPSVGSQYTLGSIQDYGATATTDESPARVDLVRTTTTAFPKSALGVDPNAWSRAAVSPEPVGAPSPSIRERGSRT